ncbi:MAG: hypothetical protein GY803_15625 [Chloroflexi bacterium]|nr:hypothetical protein [Chloroflexota bacterium]
MHKPYSPFTFAIVADAHVRLDTAVPSSDYPSNKLANGRNRRIINQINQLAPDFVIHLGDFVHPIPALPTFEPAMQLARDMYRQLDADLHVLPGNHDVGDKPNAWTPAPAVTAESHAVFERLWGPTWSSFDYEDCHFVLINTPILNSGLSREAAQRDWLERDLATNQKAGKRPFLFLHYPLYLADPQEPSHYDNIDQPARDWLLDLLNAYQVEAVFAGHVHNFFYNRYNDTDLYVLPSAAFIRPGFSELFAIEPAAEYGRNDPQKLGFTLVAIESDGYRTQPIRTHGATDSLPLLPSGQQGGIADNNIGVYLRQAWADPIIFSHGNLDEFGRKRARNDYLLWGLWELGIRKLRVPLDDLTHAGTRQRMQELQALGHQFTIFCVGEPDDYAVETLINHHDLVAAWELILPREQMEAGLRHVQHIKQIISIPTYLSKLETLADQEHETDAIEIDHFAKHGFRLTETNLPVPATVDGVVFRLEANVSPWDGVHTAVRLTQSSGKTAVIHVQLPKASEGRVYDQDLEIANRAAETAVTAAALPRTIVFLEPFVDFDRGYYPRHGLLNKRYNPRPAHDVWRHLQRIMGDGKFQADKASASEGVSAFALETAIGRCVLLLAHDETPTKLEIVWETDEGSGQWLDLQTGQVSAVDWQPTVEGIRVIRPTESARFYPALFFVDSRVGRRYAI